MTQSETRIGILKEVRGRTYDNTIHRFDHTLVGKMKLLYDNYIIAGGNAANFIATFQPTMICRLNEIEDPKKKEPFVEALKKEFANCPEFEEIIEELRIFA